MEEEKITMYGEVKEKCKEKPVEEDTRSICANIDQFAPETNVMVKACKALNLNTPCYMPQCGDDVLSKDPRANLDAMGPIGPWATGKVDWTPAGGITGVRPVGPSYSITLFSPPQWRSRNVEILDKTGLVFKETIENHNTSKGVLERTAALVAQTQACTTSHIAKRADFIGNMKDSLEMTIKEMADEISTMEMERIRLKKSLVIFGIPESIAKECLQRRTERPETERVCDTTEKELVNELALISEIRNKLIRTLEDFGQQQTENRMARQRLEFDWSGKKEGYQIDMLNKKLNNDSPIILFRPSAVRQPALQASEQYWEHFSRETLEDCERTRAQSVALRANLNSLLSDAERDMLKQAERVELALNCRIDCMEEALNRLESELRDCLQKLADTESRIIEIRHAIADFDASMKVAQTRMHNRSYRPHVESCRDVAQQLLIDEVVTIENGVKEMVAQLDAAEEVKIKLIEVRGSLEREIMLKRSALFIDQERCLEIRSRYPTELNVSGSLEDF